MADTQGEVHMPGKIFAVLIFFVYALQIGCSSENRSVDARQNVTVIPMSQADKDRLSAFRKDLTDLESLTDKTLKVASEEVMKIVKGGDASTSVAGLAEKARAECLQTSDLLEKKAVPDNLPPEIRNFLVEGKNGLAASYKAHGESYEAVRVFLAEGKPLALLEYRTKSSRARELSGGATEKLERAMATAGIPSS
jgi:hypothetical protein